jgi:large subunit ribosomal protein L9
MVRQAGEAGHLYGSVSGRDIGDAIKEQGFTIARQQVLQDQPIKTLGTFPIKVALHPEVVVTVTVIVARSQEEAERAIPAEVEPEETVEAAPEAEAE